jgi:hypothetical protein
MKRVRMRNAWANQHSAGRGGEIAEFSDEKAEALVAHGYADYIEEPKPEPESEPETATAEPEAEKAVKPDPPKRKRGRPKKSESKS